MVFLGHSLAALEEMMSNVSRRAFVLLIPVVVLWLCVSARSSLFAFGGCGNLGCWGWKTAELVSNGQETGNTIALASVELGGCRFPGDVPGEATCGIGVGAYGAVETEISTDLSDDILEEAGISFIGEIGRTVSYNISGSASVHISGFCKSCKANIIPVYNYRLYYVECNCGNTGKYVMVREFSHWFASVTADLLPLPCQPECPEN